MTLFDGGADYANYRPSYPAELPGLVSGLVDSHTLALDIGCGTGQLTVDLAAHFERVVGVDPSQSQIDHATPASGVEYVVGEAAHLPAADESVDLVTVAQAAHWFSDLDAFYDEARRIARPGAAIALVSYGVCHFSDNPEVDRVYQEFYYGDFHRHWGPGRRHVENGLADLVLPFEPLTVVCPDIVRHMRYGEFVNYLSTWSALKAPGAAEKFTDFTDTLRAAWGHELASREVRWPIAVRAGRLRASKLCTDVGADSASR